MKDIFVLLVLLTVQGTKVFSLPYEVDSDGNCGDKTREYQPDGTKLCCKKCPPGQRLKQKCTETTESVCETCEDGLYIESWNYSPNCFRCIQCATKKGLHYGQNCSSTTPSRCVCNPGMYCIIGKDDCTDCKRYKQCKAGFGVSKQGTPKSDVKCEPCKNGTFSDTASYTESCKPHANCNGRTVVRKGNATSDSVCEPLTLTQQPYTEVFTTASTAATKLDPTPPIATESIDSLTPSSLLPIPLKPTVEPSSPLVLIFAVATSVIGVLLLVVLVFLCRRTRKNDPVPPYPESDTNGNSVNKISHSYAVESQLTSYSTTSPEKQYLLEKGEASSDHSQCSNTTETRTDGCSSHESFSPLQHTQAMESNPHSDALSEPLTLQSNTEPPPPPHSIVRQSSSQPNSPQIISPVTTSPHVNVNITLHIGNGSCGTPAFLPADMLQAGSQVPFGEAEQCFCSPQQEDGKQSMMSVEESTLYSNEDFLSQTLKAI